MKYQYTSATQQHCFGFHTLFKVICNSDTQTILFLLLKIAPAHVNQTQTDSRRAHAHTHSQLPRFTQPTVNKTDRELTRWLQHRTSYSTCRLTCVCVLLLLVTITRYIGLLKLNT